MRAQCRGNVVQGAMCVREKKGRCNWIWNLDNKVMTRGDEWMLRSGWEDMRKSYEMHCWRAERAVQRGRAVQRVMVLTEGETAGCRSPMTKCWPEG
eukprot:848908-Rhodomonas_salina.1